MNRLNRDIVNVLDMPDVKDKIVAQGNSPVGDTPEQFAAFIRTESAKWARVVKLGHLKPE